MSNSNERVLVERYKGNFTTVHNDAFMNRFLSNKATGLHYLMLSFPPDWDYTIRGLAKLKKDGVDSIRAGLRELEKFGYLVRKQEKRSNGSFGKNSYILYEYPAAQNPDYPLIVQQLLKEGYAVVGFSGNGKSDDGKPGIGKSNAIKD